jgi:hypothetical protein
MGTGVFQLGQQPLIVYDSANAQPAIYRPSCRSHDTMTSMARTGPGPISGALFVGDCGIGTLTIGNGGMVNVGISVGVAVFPGSTGTVNVGAASGQPAAAPDTLNTSLAGFGDGTGRIVFNHAASNYTFAPTLSVQGRGRSMPTLRSRRRTTLIRARPPLAVAR